MKTYRPRTLFSGAVIGKDISTLYAGVPDKFKGHKIKVVYNGVEMIIDDWSTAEDYRTFPDKFGRNQNYTLDYFKFTPEGGQDGRDDSRGQESLNNEQEDLRLRLL